MKLATIRNGTRDGELVVVRKDGFVFATARAIAPTMQAALDDWDRVAPALEKLSRDVQLGAVETFPLHSADVLAPLPRAYEWVDGSAYINHIILVRKARGAEPPEDVAENPLVYQGGSSEFLAPTADIPLVDEAWGCDFESEVCVVLGDTPRGTTKDTAGKHVRLLMLANDVTLRNLIPGELAKGFGFFQSKPATAFSPLAITPDELGAAWHEGRVHLPLVTKLNGTLAGDPHAGPEMHFSFFDLVQHITKTRGFCAGTILGSGTVSNADPARGVSCLAEKRTRETIETGKATTPFLKAGDHVQIEMFDEGGHSLFGRIDQHVRAVKA